jgi:hypothetical protein
MRDEIKVWTRDKEGDVSPLVPKYRPNTGLNGPTSPLRRPITQPKSTKKPLTKRAYLLFNKKASSWCLGVWALSHITFWRKYWGRWETYQKVCFFCNEAFEGVFAHLGGFYIFDLGSSTISFSE